MTFNFPCPYREKIGERPDARDVSDLKCAENYNGVVLNCDIFIVAEKS